MKRLTPSWTLGGLFVSAALGALFLFRGRWKAARFFASLAAAFFTKWGEARTAQKVSTQLAEAGPHWKDGAAAGKTENP